MEELQDAIEDAQYMNAMLDDIPRPTKEWKKPKEEEINSYLANLRSSQPNKLTLEYICSGSLGFYFVRFVNHTFFIITI